MAREKRYSHAVGVLDGGHAVGDRDGGPAPRGAVERILHGALGGRVEGGRGLSRAVSAAAQIRGQGETHLV